MATLSCPHIVSSASEPFGYVFSWEGTRHVDYVGTNGHIYELWWNPTGWHVEDLAALTGAPLAHFGAGVWGYPFDPAPGVPNPTQHVLYRGVDSHIHELWWDSTGWHHNDLHGVPGTPLASGDSTGFAHTGRAPNTSFSSATPTTSSRSSGGPEPSPRP
jgi:hypothetical protein